MSFLEITGLSKGYGEGTARTEVLADINLSVAEGEFIAIVGFSGSGKTTLISAIAGLTKPDGGTIKVRGHDVAGPGPDRGIVFQSYSLMPWLSVNGNVALGVDAVHGSRSKAERAALVNKYVTMVGLAHATDRRPAELSGGMRQRVAVARALAMEPEALLLDEPLSALDALTRYRLQDLAAAMLAGRTVLLVTHSPGEAVRLGHRLYLLEGQPARAQGPVALPGLPPREPADPATLALEAELLRKLTRAPLREAS